MAFTQKQISYQLEFGGGFISGLRSTAILLSRPAKTLSLASVFCMSDTEAEAMFRKVRWPETNRDPVCPHCGGWNAYECRRPNGSLRFRCRLSSDAKRNTPAD